MVEEENQAKGSAAGSAAQSAPCDDEMFQKRIARLMKRIESETGSITKANAPKQHTGLKLLLATFLIGGAMTYGAYQPDNVKSITEPVYQNVVKPAVDAVSGWYESSCAKADASESYSGK